MCILTHSVHNSMQIIIKYIELFLLDEYCNQEPILKQHCTKLKLRYMYQEHSPKNRLTKINIGQLTKSCGQVFGQFTQYLSALIHICGQLAHFFLMTNYEQFIRGILMH